MPPDAANIARYAKQRRQYSGREGCPKADADAALKARPAVASSLAPRIGRPSVDPELMIRMLLVGYCYGIRHERRLCQEAAPTAVRCSLLLAGLFHPLGT